MKTKATPAIAGAWAVVLLLFVMGSALAGDEVVKDGVVHIVNGSNAAEGVETINLKEVWRAGGDDGEDFFGLISQVVIGDDGTIYLLDTRLSEVPVYSPDGERLNTLSREGEGPGETNRPSDLVMMPDGNLGLVQSFPGKVIKIDLEGTPQGDFQPVLEEGGFLVLMDCVANLDGQVTITGRNIKQAGPTARSENNFVSNFGPDGTETTRLMEMVRETDFSNFHFNEDDQNEVTFRKMSVGKDGRVYLSKMRNVYEIEVYNPDGSLDRIIEREFEPRKRSDKEYNRVYSVAEAQLAQLPGAKFDISRSEPAISSLRIHGDGNLWVTNCRSGFEQADGIFATYDVFDPDGHFIKQVAVACEGDGLEDTIFWSSDGSAVLVTGFLEAVISLQSGGAAGEGSEDDEEAEPMEVVFMRPEK
jgi:hypothetical protein